MTDYTILWLIWIAFFLVLEGAAIFAKKHGHKDDTLTANITKWASLKNKSKGWIARRGVLLVFFIWLCYHFVRKVVW